MNKSLCSFGRVSLKGTFTPKWEFATELYVRLFYLKSGDEQLLFCAFDTLGTWASDTRKFRKEISAACGIPEKSIVYHELQVHASLGAVYMHSAMDNIIKAVIPAVNALKANAKPFTCEVTEAYFGDSFTFNREQYIEGIGGVTVWTGMGFDSENRPCTNNEAIMLLQDYRPGIVDKPVYFDNNNDPYAYLFVFRDDNGKVIGSFSRFAAHPDVGVLFELRPIEGKSAMYHYDFDWTGYLSTNIENALGGISLYMNGPCGDLSTKKGYDGIDDFEASDAECKRIGKMISDALLESYNKSHRVMETSDILKSETFTVIVPMRDDMPTSNDDARTNSDEKIKRARQVFDEAKVNGSTPAQVKRTIDDYLKAFYNGIMVYDICGFDDETLAKRMVNIDIPCIKFGDYLFIGMPGESLTETATWLRSAFTGCKTIPIDQCDGYYSYMATPRTLTLGGYTYWCSWTNRQTVPAIQKQLHSLVHDFLTDK